MSIAPTSGDNGQTSLIGNRRVSKADPQVEACGSVDELISQLGFARSICEHADTRILIQEIQRQLFSVSEDLASGEARDAARLIDASPVEALTAHVHRLESQPDMVLDWALPGEHPASAALDVARTICRRAERTVVRLTTTDPESVGGHVVSYLNRLSDLLWLSSRVVEHAAGIDARLRDPQAPGPRWSRAW